MGDVLSYESGEVLEQLPREAVDAPSIPGVEVFKARLDGALGSLGWYYTWRLAALPVLWGRSLILPTQAIL